MRTYRGAWACSAALLACGGPAASETGSGEATCPLAGCGEASTTEPADSSGGATTATDASASASATSTDSTSSGAVDTSDDGAVSGPKFDVLTSLDAGVGGCGGESGGDVEFSYIWIANSNQSTVSKIDTQSLVEVGRYLTRADANGNPSRTSVNLNGDVAVANRNGGITMIRARAEDCPDASNTSSGPADVKPWIDGCIAWHTPFDYTSQRPVAWTHGTWNAATCEWEDPMLWTAGARAGIPNSIEVLLLDGETGVVTQTIPIPEVPNGAYEFGIYGAAVDGDGNFWGSQLDVGHLVRVNFDDLVHDSWPMPVVGYGMTVDHLGRPWTCNAQVARFDPVAEAWDIGAGEPGPGGAGCMEDGNGTLWVAGTAITAIDLDTMDLVAQYPMPIIGGNPDTGYGRGISIDFEGYVWSPSHWSNAAYRLDPATGEFDKVEGLDFPYTYSDMTGFALANAGVPAG
jgi:hypothetical protein